MPYIYRVTRRITPKPAAVPMVDRAVPAAEPTAAEVAEPSYRDLQAQAKALDIPANQTADDLKKAISEADDG